MPTPRVVSVVIPAYNSAGFLAQTIDSAFSQTISPAEVIVIDDGSTDGTASVLRELAKQLPAAFRWISKRNGGSASARNVGIRIATGEFIAFLDHDDLWRPQKLARQLEQFAADPALALSFTGKISIPYERTPEGSLRPRSKAGVDVRAGAAKPYVYPDWSPEPAAVLEHLISQGGLVSLSTVMVRREVFSRMGGFNEQLAIVDDWLMWVRMAAAGMRLGHVPEVLVDYRWHENNLSGDRRETRAELVSAIDQLLTGDDLPKDIRRQLRLRWWCAHWHLVTAIDEAQAGNVSSARRHILRAALVHPRSIRPGWIRMLGIGPPPRS